MRRCDRVHEKSLITETFVRLAPKRDEGRDRMSYGRGGHASFVVVELSFDSVFYFFSDFF